MKQVILAVSALFFLGCESFRLQGTMCDSLQPGEVSTECKPYSEEEAQKATEHKADKKGECLKCNEAEKIEIRTNEK
jgi:hypothetical protein